jgi:outer membrane lipoprotein SlyB
MNTTTSPNTDRSTASGIHRGVWIGGGLMALTIIALATTLVVKNNDTLPDAATAAGTTPAPLVAANTATGTPATETPPVANQPAGVAVQPAPVNPPVNESARPVHYAPAPVRHEPTRDYAPQQVAAAPVCATCGVIEGYSAVKIQGQNNGVGAVAGGLGGALVGSQIAGRHNHTLGGVVGAVGGGLLGNAIETHQRTITEYDVRVRMADGAVRTVRQSTIPNVGQRVNVEGHTLRPIDGQG